MMQLTLKRDTFTNASTIGSLFINGVFECFTLEDTYRQLDNGTVDKWAGRTAIPNGSYVVTIDKSVRFGRFMPHVLNVPQFDGIRIHSGNTDADTEGCILLGHTRGTDAVGESKLAFDAFFPKLQSAVNAGIPVGLIVSA